MKLIPANGRLIVEEVALPTYVGTIQLVYQDNNPNHKFVRGTVVAASKGFWSITGVWVDSYVNEGDIVWYNKHNVAEMTIGVTSVTTIDEKDVMVIERAE